MLFLIVFSTLNLVSSQSAICATAPAPSNLAAVSVWVRHENSSSLFRISDEDLTDEGYQRSPADRESFVMLLSREPGKCPSGPCALKLSRYRRLSDGALIQQENVFGVPTGYQAVADHFYCARSIGDCGAELPIFRLTSKRGREISTAYSLDPASSISGYTRDARPICYGWSDGGSIVHRQSQDYNCLKINTIANAKITYSSSGAGAYPIGTTATLQCVDGYAAGGQSALLCTKTGWYPDTGLGYCVRQKAARFVTGSALGKGTPCAGVGKVNNGQILFSQLEIGGRFPSGTSATVVCNLGWTASDSTPVVCEDGKWTTQNWPICLSASQIKCPPFPTPVNGKVAYEPNSNPYGTGATARLTCQGGRLSGTETVKCTDSGWHPSTIGNCGGGQAPILGCGPVMALSGKVSYIQANPQVPYSSGSSVLLACDPGFAIHGSVSSLCINGAWTPQLGTCTAGAGSTGVGILPGTGGLNIGSSGATCLDFPFSFSGVISYSLPSTAFGSHPSGTVASMSCNLGSTLTGSLSSTCSAGTWSPATLGTCTPGLGSNTEPHSTLKCANPIVGNAMITYSQSSAIEPQKPDGTIATVACNLGFVAQGGTTSTCHNGMWSPPLTTCSPTSGNNNIGTVASQQCLGGLLPPLGGTIKYSNGGPFGPFPVGTVATVSCSNGAAPAGTPSSSCQSGQWQPASLGTCSLGGTGGSGGVNQCVTALMTPLGGTVGYTMGGLVGPFPTGTTATLSCTNGQLPQAPTSALCSNGQWQPATLGSCSNTGGGTGTIGGSCVAMSTPLGGTVSYSNAGMIGPFPQGTQATVKCIDTTRTIQGSSSASCLNGQWQPSQLGACISNGIGGGLNCLAPASPLNGAVTFSKLSAVGGYPSGTSAQMTCNLGFTVSGTSSSTCQNGQWSPPLGTCQSGIGGGNIGGVGCSPVPQPLNGRVDYSTGTSFSLASGTTATLICSSGVPIGSALSTCQNGLWTPTIGSCSRAGGGSTGQGQCVTPPTAPLGATLKYSTGSVFGPWTEGTTVTLQCPGGQFPQGVSTASCSNGAWGQLATSCSTTPGGGETGGCLPLGTMSSQLVNGYASYVPMTTSRVAVGTVAVLHCSTGFTTSGPVSASCTNQGWSPQTLGQCINQGVGGGNGLNCVAVPPPLNGAVTFSKMQSVGGYSEGTSAQMTCNLGFTVSGTSSSTCQNGQWSPPLGTCQAGIGGGVTGGTQCFFGLPPVGNGKVSYNTGTMGPWTSGSTAHLACNTGFLPSGSTVSSCQNGQWQPAQLGTCSTTGTGTGTGPTLGQCQAIPTIQSGTVHYSEFGLPPYKEGTTATLFCNLGSTVSGQSTVTCRSGGWTPFPGLGTCRNSLARAPVKTVQKDAPQTKDVNCAVPMAPPFGEISFSSSVSKDGLESGTTASLRCVLGYRVLGQASATCRRGSFRPLLGKCVNEQSSPLPGACLPLSSPPHGKVKYIQSSKQTNLEIGSTALLKCSPTYAVTGVATLKCGHDGWEPSDGFGTCDSTNEIR